MAGYPAPLRRDISEQYRAGAQGGISGHIVDLLERYPQVSGAEANEILQFVKKARYVEIERLASNETLRRQLDRFMTSHKERLSYSLSELVTAIALVVAFLAICWVLWHPAGGI